MFWFHVGKWKYKCGVHAAGFGQFGISALLCRNFSQDREKTGYSHQQCRWSFCLNHKHIIHYKIGQDNSIFESFVYTSIQKFGFKRF